MFVSTLARKVFKDGKKPDEENGFLNSPADLFRGAQFHFHAQSEHTIDG
jgi:carbonic anhydrase